MSAERRTPNAERRTPNAERRTSNAECRTSNAERRTPKRGDAGPSGPKVRSDLHVSFETRSSGGVSIDLTSKVEAYFGEAIRQQAADVLSALGVEHGHLEIDDKGALPFIIAARIEAAVRRAGLGEGKRALADAVQLPPVSAANRLRRSRLYLPGSQPKLFVNAGLHGSDAIILDLEDSVHTGEKDSARILVRNALRSVDFGGAERMVRINQVGGQAPLGFDDLDEVVPELPDLILIPKVETADEVLAVDGRIRDILGRDRQEHKVWLMPILESALGIENAYTIASSSSRVVALTIGLEDLTADLGVRKTVRGDETLYARQRLVYAAKAAGVQAIDSVYGDVGDMDGLLDWGQRSRGLGFEGMGCIHPRQITVIHQAFAPSQTEIAKAVKIVAAFDEAQKQGLGVVSLGTKMIDPPVVNRALELVERARAQGLVPESTKESAADEESRT